METRKPLQLLIVEDSENDALLMVRELRRSGYEVSHRRVDTEDALLDALSSQTWNLVLSDYNMPELGGMRALAIVKNVDSEIPFILVSGSIGEELAVEAMKAGAQDYLMKDRLARLAPAVEKELREHLERQQQRQTEAALKEKEQQFIKAQRMEAIGRLAGGIAHDLNNIIGACTLYGELALNSDAQPSQTKESIRQIMNAQERAAVLIRQLLAFSRKQVVTPQIICINQIILDLESMLRRILGEDIRLEIELEPSLRSVKADPSHFDQVIMNLVVNARDAMPKGGALWIKTSNERSVGSSENKLYTRLTVQDSGLGMDQETLNRIFEPFFTTKELGKGTGLGLATVYGIVKQANGEIRVASQLGRGTCFDILLPSTEEHSVRSVPKIPSAPLKLSQAGRVILLVEDADYLRNAISEALTGAGHIVIAAGDGEDGLKAHESSERTIDLIVADVVLPKLSGPDMVERLRTTLPDVKALFLSGYGWDGLSAYGVDEKRNFLLSKPFSLLALREKIHEILGNPS